MADLMKIIRDMREAAISENMNCGCCSGHMDSTHEWHDKFCELAPLLGLRVLQDPYLELPALYAAEGSSKK